MKSLIMTLALASGLSLAAETELTNDALSARLQAAVLAGGCAGCHGTNGNLSNFQLRATDALTEQLLAFKHDRVNSTVMGRITRGYSDEELALIALFLTNADAIGAE